MIKLGLLKNNATAEHLLTHTNVTPNAAVLPTLFWMKCDCKIQNILVMQTKKVTDCWIPTVFFVSYCM